MEKKKFFTDFVERQMGMNIKKPVFDEKSIRRSLRRVKICNSGLKVKVFFKNSTITRKINKYPHGESEISREYLKRIPALFKNSLETISLPLFVNSNGAASYKTRGITSLITESR